MSLQTTEAVLASPRGEPPRDALRFVEHLVREEEPLARAILAGDAVGVRGRLAGTAVLGGALFGLAAGLPGGMDQAVMSAIKFPLVLLLSAGATLPFLYVAAALSGRRIPYDRLASLVLQALASAAVTMAALAPLVVVGWLSLSAVSGQEWWVYRRVVLLGTAVCAVGGLAGARTLLRHLPGTAALAWTPALGLAGLQLSWLLRPLFGNPAVSDLVVLRAMESSGLREVLVALVAVLS